VNDNTWLAQEFDESRTNLRAVAYRMLGSASEAEDAVQEAWLKLSRSDTSEVANLGGWLRTVVARVCLDMLRTRRSRREQPLVPSADERGDGDPENDVAFADATGQALLIVLETLAPAERVAFVLHDMFDLSFDEIVPERRAAGRSAGRADGRCPPAARSARPGSRSSRCNVSCDGLQRSRAGRSPRAHRR
jgi:RNA polymerase sigma-70 factor, ECF subfamily